MAFGPTRFSPDWSIGSPNPPADRVAALPSTTACPERLPIGKSTETLAARSDTASALPKPAIINDASKLLSPSTVCAGSNGFVLPLFMLKTMGTTVAPVSPFQ